MAYPLDGPTMSDTTLLVSVEDLINMALGADDKNIVNFKTIQTVLHILARQQRMLQQRVEIRVTERRASPSRHSGKSKRDTEASESSSSKSPQSPPPKKRMPGIKEEREDKPKEKDKDKAEKDKARAEKDKLKAEKEQAKAEKEKAKAEAEKAKAEREVAKAQKELAKAEKEKTKAEKEAQKEKEKELKAQEKADKIAQKEKEKAEKAEQKELEKAQKEKEKAAQKELEKAQKETEKAAQKELEKAQKEKEKAAQKELEKAQKEKEKAAQKELEKAQKEKEKADQAAAKEKEKADKAKAAKDKEREKEEAKAKKEKERTDASPSPAPKGKEKKKAKETPSSISVSEVKSSKGTVLVVEKGPTTRAEPRSRGASIDVVTQSQFALLEAAVRALAERAAPPAELRLPDNQQLRGDLARGRASLTDTMQAMQVNARVKAAEEAIDRMAGLLTQLAKAGALPEDMAGQVQEAKRDAEKALTSDTDDAIPVRSRPSTAPRKSVAIDPMVVTSQVGRPSTAHPSTVTPKPSALTTKPSSITARSSVSTVLGPSLSRPSSVSTAIQEPGVSRGDMEDMIKAVKNDLWKTMNNLTNKATAAAESAMNTAKGVADRLDVALKLDVRISNLYSLVTDYAEQLSGFDSGLTTQMSSFQEQIAQIRNDLQGGLTLLGNVNNNAETAAVLELTERYEALVTHLEHTSNAHQALTAFQSQLADELRSLVECVEMLREQKADRDEVIDGLRDKADSSRLAGLLTEAEFAVARAELSRRLHLCHDKFHRQDSVWMGAMKDLLKTTETKAELVELLSLRADTQRRLQLLRERLQLLAHILGEPQAALLTRQLASGATCGACGVAALMGLADPSTGAPPALPALRPAAPPAEPGLALCRPPRADDHRHICHRWAGGSHTLVSELTSREQAAPLHLHTAPTRKFADYGLDGRLYMMEEPLEPCVECNEILDKERPPPVGEDGAGDTGPMVSTILPMLLD